MKKERIPRNEKRKRRKPRKRFVNNLSETCRESTAGKGFAEGEVGFGLRICHHCWCVCVGKGTKGCVCKFESFPSSLWWPLFEKDLTQA